MQSKDWTWQFCFVIGFCFLVGLCLPARLIAQTEAPDQQQSEPAPAAPDQQDEDPAGPVDSEEDQEDSGDQRADDADEGSDGEDGSEDLSKAFSLNIEIRAISDLDQIAQLCESALKKGLGETEARQAKYLASESLLRFAETLSTRVFKTPQDRRWQIYRSQAMPRLEKAIEYDPQNVSAYVLLSRFQAIDRRQRMAALENIEKAIKLAVEERDQLSDALVIRGQLATDKDARLADFKQAIKHNPANPRARELRGRLLLAEGRIDEAIKDFDSWLELQPKNFLARIFVATNLSRLKSGQQDLRDKAIAILDEASALQSESELPDVLKSQIYFNAKDFAESLSWAETAIEKNDRSIDAWQRLIQARAANDDLDGAVTAANRLIKLDLNKGYDIRSNLYAAQQKFDLAIDDVKGLLSSQRGNESLQRRLATFYSANLQPKEAIRIYNRLLRTVSVEGIDRLSQAGQRGLLAKRVDWLSSRGDAFLSSGQHPQARQDYEESLELFDKLVDTLPESIAKSAPRNSGLLNNFAWLLSTSPDDDLRDGTRAIELSEEAAKLTKYKQAHILSTVASAYAETGDFETAIQWIEKGLAANEAAAELIGDEDAFERQKQSLLDELKSYQDKQPWRELQDIEQERLQRAAAQQAKVEKSGEVDSANDESDDSPEQYTPDSEDEDEDEDEEIG